MRAIGLLSLITFPMAIGLGAVSHTLIEVLLPPHWQGVAPFLVVLAIVSVLRPVNGLISQYLISIEQIRVLMRLEMVRVAALFTGLIILGQWGPIPAALAVGLSSLAHMVVLVRAMHGDGKFLGSLLRAVRAPLVGCAGMALMVLSARWSLEDRVAHDLVLLFAEITLGACSYVISLLLLERAAIRDVITLAKGLVRRN